MLKGMLLFSMRRSGTHAVASWICRQHRPSVHLPTCMFFSDGQFASSIADEYPEAADIVHRATEDFGLPTEYTMFLHNFEDQDVATVTKQAMKWVEDGVFDNLIRVVLIRDPYNWIASRVHGGFPDELGIYEAIKLYKSSYMWFAKNARPEQATVINFNKWHVDQEYRKEIADALDLVFTDEGHDEFYSKSESKFEDNLVLERYKHVDVVESFIDDELREFARDYFGIEVD